MLSSEQDEYQTIQFEETELRLGLPGGQQENGAKSSNAKRGFSETEIESETSVNLKLNLSTALAVANDCKSKIETPAISSMAQNLKEKIANATRPNSDSNPAKPPAKAQIVGWPPVRSFRKNMVTVQKKIEEDQTDQKMSNGITTSTVFVKVSMDGAPYLRKVDLKLYKSYEELSEAIGNMFSSFTIGNCESHGGKDFLNENKLIDLLNGSEYVATYEDRDGDWMLVGDVPWLMFVNSCKRLRIMKGSEAIGLAPRAVEKCKSRS